MSVSVIKVKNSGRPTLFRSKVMLFKMSDVKTWPSVDAKGVLASDDLELNVGANAIEIDVVSKTLKVYHTVEGDADKKGNIHNVEFEHPGSELEFEEFVEEWLNEDCGAILMNHDLTNARLAGTPGNPLQLTVEDQNDSDGNSNTLKFASLLRGARMIKYEGVLPPIDSSGSGA